MSITRDALLKLQAKAMSEDDLLTNIIDEAHARRWKVAHFRPAKTGKGWRTPVQGDGKGFPDLVMLRWGHVIIAELKAQRAKVESGSGQEAWLQEWAAVATGDGYKRVLTFVWKPMDWLDETIRSVLA